jgi:hypothetical protein
MQINVRPHSLHFFFLTPITVVLSFILCLIWSKLGVSLCYAGGTLLSAFVSRRRNSNRFVISLRMLDNDLYFSVAVATSVLFVFSCRQSTGKCLSLFGIRHCVCVPMFLLLCCPGSVGLTATLLEYFGLTFHCFSVVCCLDSDWGGE